MSLRRKRTPSLHEIYLLRGLWSFLPHVLGPPPAALDLGERFSDAHFMLDQIAAEDRSRPTGPSQTVDINCPTGIERLFDGHLNLAHPISRRRIHIRYGQTPVSDSPIPGHRLFLEELRVRLKPFAFLRQIEKEVHACVQK